MIDESEKNKKNIKQGPIYAEIPIMKNCQIVEKVVKR